jgi:HAD superfamily hydrolase (TIGR01509 family)
VARRGHRRRAGRTLIALLFDLDGLLADTERLHSLAYRTALSEIGVEVSEAEYGEHWIRRGLGIVEMCALRELSHSPEMLRARKAVLYDQLVRATVQPMPGARALLAGLEGQVPMAIATSCFRDAADAVLETLGFCRYFSAIVTGSDVTRPKPAPDLFLEAARRLGAPPARCVALEDAEKGVHAAHAGGIRVVAIPNEHTRHHDFSRASLVVESLEELTLQRLTDLVRSENPG